MNNKKTSKTKEQLKQIRDSISNFENLFDAQRYIKSMEISAPTVNGAEVEPQTETLDRNISNVRKK